MFWTMLWLALFLMIVLVLFSHMHIRLKYSRMHQNDVIQYEVHSLWGLVHFRVQIPVIHFSSLNREVEVQSEFDLDRILSHSGMRMDEEITMEKIIQFVRRLQELKQYVHGFSDWFQNMSSYVKCTYFQWHSRMGTKEAHVTAILTGVIWGLKMNILRMWMSRITFQTKPDVQVHPVYNLVHFSTEWISEMKLRHGHALLMVVFLFFRVIKVKGGWKVWFKAIRTLYLFWKKNKKVYA